PAGHRIEKISEVPLVVSDSVQDLKKTKEAVAFLKRVKAWPDIQKVYASQRFRAGRGKMRNRARIQKRGPLVIYAKDNGLCRAFRNIPGVTLICVSRLNLLKLAPGGHLGRFVIWSESAFRQLDQIYAKSKLPDNKMASTDLTGILRSDEVKAAVRPRQARQARAVLKKNPLKNVNVMAKLNPYALVLKRKAILAQRKALAKKRKADAPASSQKQQQKKQPAAKKAKQAAVKGKAVKNSAVAKAASPIHRRSHLHGSCRPGPDAASTTTTTTRRRRRRRQCRPHRPGQPGAETPASPTFQARIWQSKPAVNKLNRCESSPQQAALASRRWPHLPSWRGSRPSRRPPPRSPTPPADTPVAAAAATADAAPADAGALAAAATAPATPTLAALLWPPPPPPPMLAPTPAGANRLPTPPPLPLPPLPPAETLTLVEDATPMEVPMPPPPPRAAAAAAEVAQLNVPIVKRQSGNAGIVGMHGQPVDRSVQPDGGEGGGQLAHVPQAQHSVRAAANDSLRTGECGAGDGARGTKIPESLKLDKRQPLASPDSNQSRLANHFCRASGAANRGAGSGSGQIVARVSRIRWAPGIARSPSIEFRSEAKRMKPNGIKRTSRAWPRYSDHRQLSPIVCNQPDSRCRPARAAATKIPSRESPTGPRRAVGVTQQPGANWQVREGNKAQTGHDSTLVWAACLSFDSLVDCIAGWLLVAADGPVLIAG
uniref:Ribos_L4_asso_C domain-containing protein n=1 Tax=Macrostomum lignano TaxID=282301 RepID=A0A1I8FAZ1_9PLAT